MQTNYGQIALCLSFMILLTLLLIQKFVQRQGVILFANTYSIIKNVRPYKYTWNMIKIGMWHLLHVCRSNNLAHVSMFCPPLTLDPTVSLLSKMNKNIQPFWLSTRYYFFCHKFRIFTYLKEVVNKLTFKQVKLVKLTSLFD